MASRTRSTPESTVVRDCLDLLRYRGVYAWRNNTGCLKDRTGRPVRYGMPGSSDLLGVLPGGRFLAVECKAGRGRLTIAQEFFLATVRAHGGVAVVCRDVAVLAHVLEILADYPLTRFTLEGEIVR